MRRTRFKSLYRLSEIMKKKVRKSKNKFWIFVLCLAIVFIAALIGGLFTDTGAWYEKIKPSITPPNYVFPIVWNILFFLIALSLFFSWINADKKQKKSVMIIFGLNLIFNILWSVFYFGLKNVSLAFLDLILIWISIIAMIKIAWKIDRKASLLLVPYLLWVSFAGVLNYLSLGMV